MPVSYNEKTREAIRLTPQNEWVPTDAATNSQGAIVIFDGSDWVLFKKQQEKVSSDIFPISRDETGAWQFDAEAGLLGAAQIPQDVFTGKINVIGADGRASPEGLAAALKFSSLVTPGSPVNRIAGSMFSPKGKPPTRTELKTAAGRGYDALEKSNAFYWGKSLNTWANETAITLEKQFKMKESNPEVFNILKRFSNDISIAVKVGVLENARKELNTLAGGIDKSKAFTAREALRHLDNFVDNTVPKKISGKELVDDVDIIPILKDARSNAAAKIRSEKITETGVESAFKVAATGPGRSFDKVTRNKFNLIRKNKKNSRGFNEKEKTAIKNIIVGANSKNASRWLADKLAPKSLNTQAAMLAAALAGFNAVGLPGAALALIPPVIGAAARGVGKTIAKKQINRLDELTRGRSALADAMKRARPKGAVDATVPLAIGKTIVESQLPTYGSKRLPVEF